jgi:sulfatase maturation enzyme AslB (radical SAM superfamily)
VLQADSLAKIGSQGAFGQTPSRLQLDRLSIELTNTCDKACPFCYNSSHPQGTSEWTPDELVALVSDCARHGIAAVSFGGGEPLQVADMLFAVLGRLAGLVFRSFTTNGLLLDDLMDRVVAQRPDKVHISIHFPDHEREVSRVVRQVNELAARGIPSGVNLLVRKSGLEAAATAARRLAAAAIGPERVIFLPMRGHDTPSPQELAAVAGSPRFQSMTCLPGCAAS